jgi:hypothetical protein
VILDQFGNVARFVGAGIRAGAPRRPSRRLIDTPRPAPSGMTGRAGDDRRGELCKIMPRMMPRAIFVRQIAPLRTVKKCPSLLTK